MEKIKISSKDATQILPKLANSLLECMEWMDGLKHSGDAGYWEWEEGSEYMKAKNVLFELNEIILKSKKPQNEG